MTCIFISFIQMRHHHNAQEIIKSSQGPLHTWFNYLKIMLISIF